MKIRKVIQIISFALLAYLLYNISSKLDIAPIKNDHLLASKKDEISTIDNVDKAKKEAIKNLNTIRNIHKDNSSDAKFQILIIALLIIAQGYLSLTKPNRNGT